jgi:hypothetical protein
VQKSLALFGVKTLPRLLVASFVLSFIPFPENYYLGTKGQPIFTPLAPLLLLAATGMVYVSWWLIEVLMWPIGKIGVRVFGRCVLRLKYSTQSRALIDQSRRSGVKTTSDPEEVLSSRWLSSSYSYFYLYHGRLLSSALG